MTFVEVWWLYPEECRLILIVNGRFFWELATVLAHTEALSMLRVGGRYNDPSLIPSDPQKRPK